MDVILWTTLVAIASVIWRYRAVPIATCLAEAWGWFFTRPMLEPLRSQKRTTLRNGVQETLWELRKSRRTDIAIGTEVLLRTVTGVVDDVAAWSDAVALRAGASRGRVVTAVRQMNWYPFVSRTVLLAVLAGLIVALRWQPTPWLTFGLTFPVNIQVSVREVAPLFGKMIMLGGIVGSLAVASASLWAARRESADRRWVFAATHCVIAIVFLDSFIQIVRQFLAH